MGYEEFKRMITERLQAMFGDAVEINIDTYYKNNETKIESLVFKEKTPANPIAVSPAVNLKDLYELFQKSGKGKEFEDCLSLIKRLYEEQEPKTVKSVRDDWDRTKDRVFMTLVNKWEDLDLESKEKTLTVNRTLVRIRDKKVFAFQEPKTASGTRTIPLQESVVRALKRQKINQAHRRLSGKWNPPTDFEGLVFSGKKGQPQWRSCIAESLNKIIIALNEEEKERAFKERRTPVIMEHINLHACRHSFATRCLEAGIAPKIVQSWLGHSSIEITLDLYSHVNQDVSFENMRRLEALYSNAI